MKKMVSLLQPFVMQQALIVFEDDKKIDTITTTLNDFPEIVYQTSIK